MRAFFTARFARPVVLALKDFFKDGVLNPNFILTLPYNHYAMVAKQGITEELKVKDQMAWVSAMEQIKHTAEEFVFEDLVYAGGISK